MENVMGRPLKFKTVEELTIAIDNYFNTCPKDEWTITGLAIALDTYRSTLVDYGSGKYDEEDKDFSNTIKKAKQIVENGYEIDLKKHGRSGTIFALKNFDWKDKTEQDVTTNGKDITGSVLDKVLNSYVNNNRREDTSNQGDIQ
jgi:hypothetical protein